MQILQNLAIAAAFSSLAAILGLFLARSLSRYLRQEERTVDDIGGIGALVSGVLSLTFIMLRMSDYHGGIQTALSYGALAQTSALLVPAITLVVRISTQIGLFVCCVVDMLFKR